MKKNLKITYKDSGVDIDAGNRFVERIKPLVQNCTRPEVLGGIGGFAGLFSFQTTKYKDPVLVSSTDGVGTKVKLASKLKMFSGIGIDLVAMNVNDIATVGAQPLFFLDYLAHSNLKPDHAVEIVSGISQGCKQAGCALIGGETAQMPSLYRRGDFDLAGFALGVVERDRIIDGSSVAIGNVVIGIASSGLHSNGYSLVNNLIQKHKIDLGQTPKGFEVPLGQILIKPTKIYVKTILSTIRDLPVASICHITGGGFFDNLPRVLPPSCSVVIKTSSWEIPPVFGFLQKLANLTQEEMFRTFNNGIGLIIIVPKDSTDEVLSRITRIGEKAWAIGEVVKKPKTGPTVKLS